MKANSNSFTNIETIVRKNNEQQEVENNNAAENKNEEVDVDAIFNNWLGD